MQLKCRGDTLYNIMYGDLMDGVVDAEFSRVTIPILYFVISSIFIYLKYIINEGK